MKKHQDTSRNRERTERNTSTMFFLFYIFSKISRRFSHKAISLLVLITFLTSSVIPPSVLAQMQPETPLGGVLELTPAFHPPVLKGIVVEPKKPFQFDFILDKGDFIDHQSSISDPLKEESEKLIKYFLASLTIPEDELWVNLSPYEKDRIVPEKFGTTEMGRDLLAQDYILKQLTSSLMYPENELGKEFWDKIYKKAQELYGTTDIPVDTFNKVWIVPDKAVVYENGNRAFVVESRLRVMLEQDYFAQGEVKEVKNSTATTSKSALTSSPSITSDIIKQIIIPALEKEVNEGEHFAKLRQIYHSLILAVWYKKNLRESLLNRKYSDQKKTNGVEIEDKDEKYKIYEQYLESFKQGVYNYIKEDYDPAKQEIVARKYFSGGAGLNLIESVFTETTDSAMLNLNNPGLVEIKGGYQDFAMTHEKDTPEAGADGKAHEIMEQGVKQDAAELEETGQRIRTISDEIIHEMATLVSILSGDAFSILDAVEFNAQERRDVDEIIKGANRSYDFFKEEIKSPHLSNIQAAKILFDFKTEFIHGLDLLERLFGVNKSKYYAELKRMDNLKKRFDRIIDKNIVREKFKLGKAIKDSLEYAPRKDGDGKVIGSLRYRPDLSIRFNFDPAIPKVYLDKYKMFQVFINLFNNANDAMEGRSESQERHELNIETHLIGGKEKTLQIKISDTGKGIPAEKLPRIFDKDFTFGKEGGTGQGLHIVKEIIKAHGGTITAESELGKGTTFIITLPVIQQGAENIGHGKDETKPAGDSVMMIVPQIPEDAYNVFHAQKLDVLGEKFMRENSAEKEAMLKGRDKFSGFLRRLGGQIGTRGPIAYYPFGGVDAFTSFNLIKDATDVISVGEQPFGGLQALAKVFDPQQYEVMFNGAMNYKGFDPNRFLLYMEKHMAIGGLGLLRIPLLLDGKIEGLYYFNVGVNGKIKFLNEKDVHDPKMVKNNAVIEFIDPKDHKKKRFWYIQSNIYEFDPYFISFIKGLSFQTLLIKAPTDEIFEEMLPKRWIFGNRFRKNMLYRYDQNIISPAKNNKAIVVCDQFTPKLERTQPIWKEEYTPNKIIMKQGEQFGYSATGGFVYFGKAENLIDFKKSQDTAMMTVDEWMQKPWMKNIKDRFPDAGEGITTFLNPDHFLKVEIFKEVDSLPEAEKEGFLTERIKKFAKKQVLNLEDISIRGTFFLLSEGAGPDIEQIFRGIDSIATKQNIVDILKENSLSEKKIKGWIKKVYASILSYNHLFADKDMPIFRKEDLADNSELLRILLSRAYLEEISVAYKFGKDTLPINGESYVLNLLSFTNLLIENLIDKDPRVDETKVTPEILVKAMQRPDKKIASESIVNYLNLLKILKQKSPEWDAALNVKPEELEYVDKGKFKKYQDNLKRLKDAADFSMLSKDDIERMRRPEIMGTMKDLNNLKMEKVLFVSYLDSKGFLGSSRIFENSLFGSLSFDSKFKNIRREVKNYFEPQKKDLEDFFANLDQKYQMVFLGFPEPLGEEGLVEKQLQSKKVIAMRDFVKKIRKQNPYIPIVLYFNGDITSEVIKFFGEDLHYYSDRYQNPKFSNETFLQSVFNDYKEKQTQKRLNKKQRDVYRFMVKNKPGIMQDLLKAGFLLEKTTDPREETVDNLRGIIRSHPDEFDYLNNRIFDLFSAIYPQELDSVGTVFKNYNKSGAKVIDIFKLESLDIKANIWLSEYCLGRDFVKAFSPYIDFTQFSLHEMIENTFVKREKGAFVFLHENFGNPNKNVLDPKDFQNQLNQLRKMKKTLTAKAYNNLMRQFTFKDILNLHSFLGQQKIEIGANPVLFGYEVQDGGYSVRLLPDVKIPYKKSTQQFVLSFFENKSKMNISDKDNLSLKQYRNAFELLTQAEELNDQMLKKMMDLSKKPDVSQKEVLALLGDLKKFINQFEAIIRNKYQEGKDAESIERQEREVEELVGTYYRQIEELENIVESQEETTRQWKGFVKKMMTYQKEDLRIHTLVHHVHQDILNSTVTSWTRMSIIGGAYYQKMSVHVVDEKGNRAPIESSHVAFMDVDSPAEKPARYNNSFSLQYVDLSENEAKSQGAKEFLVRFFYQLLGHNFVPSDHYKAIIYDNQISLYLGVGAGLGAHTPLLFIHLGNSEKNGRISVRWQDCKDEKSGGEMRNELIYQALEKLSFDAKMDNRPEARMTVGIYDKNSDSPTRNDIETTALMAARLFIVSTNIDNYLQNKIKYIENFDLKKIADFLLESGQYPIFNLVLKKDFPEIDLESVKNLIEELNKELSRLGLKKISSTDYLNGKKHFGQFALDQYFNWPIQQLIDRNILYIDGKGKVIRANQYKEPDKRFTIVSGKVTKATAVRFNPMHRSDSQTWSKYYDGKIVVADRITLDDLSLIKGAVGLVTKRGNKTGHVAMNVGEWNIPWIVTDQFDGFRQNIQCQMDPQRSRVKFGDDIQKIKPLELTHRYLDLCIRNIPKFKSIEGLSSLYNSINARRDRTKEISSAKLKKLSRAYTEILDRISELQNKTLKDVMREMEQFPKTGLSSHDLDKLIRVQKEMARFWGSKRPPIYKTIKDMIEKDRDVLLKDIYKDQDIIAFSEGGKISSGYVGNKGSRFVETQNMLLESRFMEDLYFPQGFLITNKVFEDHIRKASGKSVQEWFSFENRPSFREMREFLLKADFSEKIQSEILNRYHALLQGKRISVRSSSFIEGSKVAFSGMAETVLNVSENELLDAEKVVLASLLEDRAVEYVERNHLGYEYLRQGQIVMEMIDADVSGVIRTVDPNQVEKNVMVAEVVLGLGPGVVEDEVGSDRIEINKEDGSFIYTVGEKDEKIVSDPDNKGELKKVEVEYKEAVKPALTKEQIKLLSDVAQYIEDYYGYPLAIEFCFKDGKLTILQDDTLGGLILKGKEDYVNKLTSNINRSLSRLSLLDDHKELINPEVNDSLGGDAQDKAMRSKDKRDEWAGKMHLNFVRKEYKELLIKQIIDFFKEKHVFKDEVRGEIKNWDIEKKKQWFEQWLNAQGPQGIKQFSNAVLFPKGRDLTFEEFISHPTAGFVDIISVLKKVLPYGRAQQLKEYAYELEAAKQLKDPSYQRFKNTITENLKAGYLLFDLLSHYGKDANFISVARENIVKGGELLDYLKKIKEMRAHNPEILENIIKNIRSYKTDEKNSSKVLEALVKKLQETDFQLAGYHPQWLDDWEKGVQALVDQGVSFKSAMKWMTIPKKIMSSPSFRKVNGTMASGVLSHATEPLDIGFPMEENSMVDYSRRWTVLNEDQKSAQVYFYTDAGIWVQWDVSLNNGIVTVSENPKLWDQNERQYFERLFLAIGSLVHGTKIVNSRYADLPMRIELLRAGLLLNDLSDWTFKEISLSGQIYAEAINAIKVYRFVEKNQMNKWYQWMKMMPLHIEEIEKQMTFEQGVRFRKQYERLHQLGVYTKEAGDFYEIMNHFIDKRLPIESIPLSTSLQSIEEALSKKSYPVKWRSILGPEELHTYFPKGYIKLIVENLVNNGENWKDKAEENVDVTFSKEEEHIKIVIQDRGNGGALKDLWAKARVGASGRERGTGIGLPLVKYLIQDLGGTLDVDSPLGVGTTVTVTLPIVKSRATIDNERSTDKQDSAMGVFKFMKQEDYEIRDKFGRLVRIIDKFGNTTGEYTYKDDVGAFYNFSEVKIFNTRNAEEVKWIADSNKVYVDGKEMGTFVPNFGIKENGKVIKEFKETKLLIKRESQLKGVGITLINAFFKAMRKEHTCFMEDIVNPKVYAILLFRGKDPKIKMNNEWKSIQALDRKNFPYADYFAFVDPREGKRFYRIKPYDEKGFVMEDKDKTVANFELSLDLRNEKPVFHVKSSYFDDRDKFIGQNLFEHPTTGRFFKVFFSDNRLRMIYENGDPVDDLVIHYLKKESLEVSRNPKAIVLSGYEHDEKIGDFSYHKELTIKMPIFTKDQIELFKGRWDEIEDAIKIVQVAATLVKTQLNKRTTEKEDEGEKEEISKSFIETVEDFRYVIFKNKMKEIENSMQGSGQFTNEDYEVFLREIFNAVNAVHKKHSQVQKWFLDQFFPFVNNHLGILIIDENGDFLEKDDVNKLVFYDFFDKFNKSFGEFISGLHSALFFLLEMKNKEVNRESFIAIIKKASRSLRKFRAYLSMLEMVQNPEKIKIEDIQYWDESKALPQKIMKHCFLPYYVVSKEIEKQREEDLAMITLHPFTKEQLDVIKENWEEIRKSLEIFQKAGADIKAKFDAPVKDNDPGNNRNFWELIHEIEGWIEKVDDIQENGVSEYRSKQGYYYHVMGLNDLSKIITDIRFHGMEILSRIRDHLSPFQEASYFTAFDKKNNLIREYAAYKVLFYDLEDSFVKMFGRLDYLNMLIDLDGNGFAENSNVKDFFLEDSEFKEIKRYVLDVLYKIEAYKKLLRDIRDPMSFNIKDVLFYVEGEGVPQKTYEEFLIPLQRAAKALGKDLDFTSQGVKDPAMLNVPGFSKEHLTEILGQWDAIEAQMSILQREAKRVQAKVKEYQLEQAMGKIKIWWEEHEADAKRLAKNSEQTDTIDIVSFLHPLTELMDQFSKQYEPFAKDVDLNFLRYSSSKQTGIYFNNENMRKDASIREVVFSVLGDKIKKSKDEIGLIRHILKNEKATKRLWENETLRSHPILLFDSYLQILKDIQSPMAVDSNSLNHPRLNISDSLKDFYQNFLIPYQQIKKQKEIDEARRGETKDIISIPGSDAAETILKIVHEQKQAIVKPLMREFKLFLSDLDDTIMKGHPGPEENALSDKAVSLISKQRAQGRFFVAATAKDLEKVRELFSDRLSDMARAHQFLITDNGSRITQFDEKGKELKTLLTMPISKDDFFVQDVKNVMEEEIEKINDASIVRRFDDGEGQALGLKIFLSDEHKVLKEQLAKNIRHRLEQNPKFKGIHVLVSSIAINVTRGDKGFAAQYILNLLGMKERDVLIMGDSEVDDPMYQALPGATKVYFGEKPYDGMPEDVILFPVWGHRGGESVLEIVGAGDSSLPQQKSRDASAERVSPIYPTREELKQYYTNILMWKEDNPMLKVHLDMLEYIYEKGLLNENKKNLAKKWADALNVLYHHEKFGLNLKFNAALGQQFIVEQVSREKFMNRDKAMANDGQKLINKALNSSIFKMFKFGDKQQLVFRQIRLYSSPFLEFYIKELIDNVIKEGPKKGVYLKEYTLRGWKLAKERAGGLMMPFVIGKAYKEEYPIKKKPEVVDIIMQKRSRSFTLNEKLEELAKQNNVDGIKKVIKEFFMLDQELMKRGIYMCDPTLENAIFDDQDKLVFIDAGMFESDPDYTDFELRGKSHFFNNIFLNSLVSFGLSKKEIDEIMLTYYDASGVSIKGFNDEMFAFFENGIKQERYEATGEQDYEKYFNKSAKEESWREVKYDPSDDFNVKAYDESEQNSRHGILFLPFDHAMAGDVRNPTEDELRAYYGTIFGNNSQYKKAIEERVNIVSYIYEKGLLLMAKDNSAIQWYGVLKKLRETFFYLNNKSVLLDFPRIEAAREEKMRNDPKFWKKESTKDKAMGVNNIDQINIDDIRHPISDIPNKGGIDLNPNKLNFETRGSGAQFIWPDDPAELELIEINGLVPVIFSITPVTNLPLLLGLNVDGSGPKNLDTHQSPRGLTRINSLEPVDKKS